MDFAPLLKTRIFAVNFMLGRLDTLKDGTLSCPLLQTIPNRLAKTDHADCRIVILTIQLHLYTSK